MCARIGAIVVAFAVAITGSANAQERFGALQSKVTDQQGSAVPGVTVLITNADTRAPRTVVTDSNGVFVAPDLTPGATTSRSSSQASPSSRDPMWRSWWAARSMSTRRCVWGQLTETVQVTGESTPLVDTRSTLIAHNVTAEELDRIPKGRSFS